MATAPVRKNFEFDSRYSEMITSLKKVCGLKTETSVMEEALVLFAWAAAEVRKGNKIGAYDEDKGVLREITSTALEKARHWAPDTEDGLPLTRAM
ncbi:hypothetical protein ELG79_36540 [Rhizobium leguminosarum]|uniref:hypothetical protein n=1 Tax=Rhizobium leguminosarum TaxID=384 RepID=UPI001032083F|nr:hypothetical protein [Rhizobium leguminosarum]TBG08432.1 hypothetical protein ELG79_36540 [Rhizobium leguminosarum]